MRKLLIWAAAIALGTGIAVGADRIVLDLKDYDDDIMKDLDRTIKFLEPDISAQNNESVSEDVKILFDGFKYTEQYFTAKGPYQDAVKWSLEGQRRLSAILKDVSENNYDAAVLEARTVVQQCKNCHEVYKPVTAR